MSRILLIRFGSNSYFGQIQNNQLLIDNEDNSDISPIQITEQMQWYYFIQTTDNGYVHAYKVEQTEYWNYTSDGGSGDGLNLVQTYTTEHKPYTLLIDKSGHGFVMHTDFTESHNVNIIYSFWIEVDSKEKQIIPRILEVFHSNQNPLTIIKDFYYIELTNSTEHFLFRYVKHFTTNILSKYHQRAVFVDLPPIGYIENGYVFMIDRKHSCVYKISFNSLNFIRNSLKQSKLIQYTSLTFEEYFDCAVVKQKRSADNSERCQRKLPSEMIFILPSSGNVQQNHREQLDEENFSPNSTKMRPFHKSVLFYLCIVFGVIFVLFVGRFLLKKVTEPLQLTNVKTQTTLVSN